MSHCQTSFKSCKEKLANKALHSSTNSSSQANIILLQLWPPSSKPLETNQTFSLIERLNHLTPPYPTKSRTKTKVLYSFLIFFDICPQIYLTPPPSSPFSILQIFLHHNGCLHPPLLTKPFKSSYFFTMTLCQILSFSPLNLQHRFSKRTKLKALKFLTPKLPLFIFYFFIFINTLCSNEPNEFYEPTHSHTIKKI